MDASQLTDAQHRALAVLAAAHHDSRPCRAGNKTTAAAAAPHLEMLTIQTRVADWFESQDLAWITNPVLKTLQLTDTGRALAREAGL